MFECCVVVSCSIFYSKGASASVIILIKSSIINQPNVPVVVLPFGGRRSVRRMRCYKFNSLYIVVLFARHAINVILESPRLFPGSFLSITSALHCQMLGCWHGEADCD